MVNQGLAVVLTATTLLLIVVISGIVVRLNPPRPKAKSKHNWQGMEPVRQSTKWLRDGTRLTTYVYRSEQTGEVYRRTIRTRLPE